MKQFEDISLEELQQIAADESVAVPESLKSDISAGLDVLAFTSEEKPVHNGALIRIAGVAASLALLVGIGLSISNFRAPKDTFSDPYLAYAQLEETFSLISSKMDKGMEMAQEAENVLAKTNEIMDKVK